jgi:hypothetical protein
LRNAKDNNEALEKVATHLWETDQDISDDRDVETVIDKIKTSDALGVWTAYKAIELAR